jgi:signal-transduction protein with cAMP-binding, CBS, and nucleotidyltransferase domain
LISVRPSDQLGDALAVMIQKRVHRVVVAELSSDGTVDSSRIVGVLEALDLFSFLSNHSYLISIKIIESKDVTELAQAAQHINRLIALLHQGGTRVSLIAMLVQELIARLLSGMAVDRASRARGQWLPVRDGKRRPGRGQRPTRQRADPARRQCRQRPG